MFDDVLTHVARIVAEGAPASAVTGDSSAVMVALIGTAGLVVSSIIAGYFATRSDRGRRTRAQISEVELEAAHAENERRDADAKAADLELLLKARDRFLYRRRFDAPRILTGLETDDDVKF